MFEDDFLPVRWLLKCMLELGSHYVHSYGNQPALHDVPWQERHTDAPSAWQADLWGVSAARIGFKLAAWAWPVDLAGKGLARRKGCHAWIVAAVVSTGTADEQRHLQQSRDTQQHVWPRYSGSQPTLSTALAV